MHTGEKLPAVSPQATISEALLEMTSKGMGLTAITDTDQRVIGIYTDGDLRRTLDKKNIDIHAASIDDVMSRHCITIEQHILAAEALKIMQDKKINGALVTDKDNVLVGAINMHDILQAGVV